MTTNEPVQGPALLEHAGRNARAEAVAPRA
jgi:hypothetical protein